MILWALISVLFFGLIILYCIFAAVYRAWIKDEQTISYNEFISLYAIATNKWIITNNFYPCAYYDGSYIYMKRYCDMIMLGLLSQKKRRQKMEAELDKRKAELIKKWQKDINDYHDEYVDEEWKITTDEVYKFLDLAKHVIG